MSSTLTIRLPSALREALKHRAAALKKSETALIRELIARELSEPDWNEIISRFAGSVDSNESNGPAHPLSDYLSGQNWRP